MNIFYSKFLPKDSYLSDFQLQDSLSEAEVLVRFDLMSILVPQRRRFLLHVAHLKCITSCLLRMVRYAVSVTCCFGKALKFGLTLHLSKTQHSGVTS